MNKIYFVNNYINMAFNVVKWNFVSGEDRSLTKMKKQLELIVEEAQEVIDAETDHELAGEICDVFVVGSFLAFINEYYNVFSYEDTYSDIYTSFPRDYTPTVDSLKSLAYDLKTYVERIQENGVITVANVAQIVRYTVTMMIVWSHIYHEDIFQFVSAKLTSNWSKYPMVDSIDAQEECKRIEALGRYSNVEYTICRIDENTEVYVFRCDGGTGKIVKPSTFKEAKFIFTK